MGQGCPQEPLQGAYKRQTGRALPFLTILSSGHPWRLVAQYEALWQVAVACWSIPAPKLDTNIAQTGKREADWED